jgi:hypothetical protein
MVLEYCLPLINRTRSGEPLFSGSLGPNEQEAIANVMQATRPARSAGEPSRRAEVLEMLEAVLGSVRKGIFGSRWMVGRQNGRRRGRNILAALSRR